jgi:SAM-dependent MidA family methyltransferase
LIIGCFNAKKELYSTIIMSAQVESVEPIPGMDGVFRVQYRNELFQKLQAGLVPIDVVTRFLTKHYYDQHGIGSDFLTPPEFFPETGNCYARLALRSYEQLGSPDVFSVFEAGGGNGTFMRGFLKEASRHESFFSALTYHVIEQSEGLMTWQRNQILDLEQRNKIIWHNEDVTTYEFPEIDAAMYIALENDDDLPSKAVYKRNGRPQEVFLRMQTGAVVEEVHDPSPELDRCIKQNSEWWSSVMQRRFYSPVPG